MPATVIEFELTIGSDLDSSDIQSLKERLLVRLHCLQPRCWLTLRVQAGSTAITVVMTIPDDDGDDDGDAAADAERAARQLLAQDQDELSSDLDVEVVGRSDSPSIARSVSVWIVVAPPPPPQAGSGDPTIVGITLGILGVLAVGGIVAYRLTLAYANRQQNALLVSDSGAGRRHRPIVTEMRMQRDGTVRGTELIVHADHASVKGGSPWSAI